MIPFLQAQHTLIGGDMRSLEKQKACNLGPKGLTDWEANTQ